MPYFVMHSLWTVYSKDQILFRSLDPELGSMSSMQIHSAEQDQRVYHLLDLCEWAWLAWFYACATHSQSRGLASQVRIRRGWPM